MENKTENEKKCIELFNYLPLSIFLMENVFDWNILNFLNSQFEAILKDLNEFYEKKDIIYINSLMINNKINNIDDLIPISISKKEFINNIKSVSLKYFSYQIKGELVELFYTFIYIKKILNFEINYLLSLKTIRNDFSKLKGGVFEELIKHKFILDKDKLQVDGFIKVNKIINMILVDEYKYINIEEIKKKNCIFIFQEDNNEEDYDFAILYPQSKEIILMQSKYKLQYKEVKHITYFSSKNKVKIIKDTLKKFNINIEKIYVLYVSSVEHNEKDNAFNILNNRKVNCLFYNITSDFFTSNYKNNITDYKSLSTQIYPKVEEYISQNFVKRKRFNQSLITTLKRIQNERQKLIIAELDEEYQEFINFLLLKGINSSLMKHFGNFYNKQMAPVEFPILTFNFYAIFFKPKTSKKIDYTKDLILEYEENNLIHYYDIQHGKESTINLETLLKEYCLIVGIWIDNKEIKLQEEEEEEE